MSGQFVISLDFELLWGVRDHSDKQSYGQNVLGAREAVPRIRELATGARHWCYMYLRSLRVITCTS